MTSLVSGMRIYTPVMLPHPELMKLNLHGTITVGCTVCIDIAVVASIASTRVRVNDINQPTN